MHCYLPSWKARETAVVLSDQMSWIGGGGISLSLPPSLPVSLSTMYMRITNTPLKEGMAVDTHSVFNDCTFNPSRDISVGASSFSTHSDSWIMHKQHKEQCTTDTSPTTDLYIQWLERMLMEQLPILVVDNFWLGMSMCIPSKWWALHYSNCTVRETAAFCSADWYIAAGYSP